MLSRVHPCIYTCEMAYAVMCSYDAKLPPKAASSKCARQTQQLGGASPPHNLMEVKC